MMNCVQSILLSLIIILTASCATPPSPSSAAPATQTSTPVPTVKPTKTVAPTATSIPGFEDWSVFKPEAVDIKTDNGSLILTLKYRALWFMKERGVLLYKPVKGDFKITGDIQTAKSSDPSQPPGGDSSIQLGGLMARNGDGVKENYVFIVVGDDSDGLSVETKTTLDSESKYDGPHWDSADAELRLCRFGQTFNLYKRHIHSNETWLLAASFDRPDLPETLQVGVNIYTNSEPDIQIRYDNLKIESISDQSACETN